MDKTCEFIRDCGVFMMLTMNGDFPAGRPFGAMTEIEGNLFVCTGSEKAAYRQMKEHSQVQIVALKNGTREWIRVDGIAEECYDLQAKAQMLQDCPDLLKHYSAPDDEAFRAFGIQVIKSVLYTSTGAKKLV